MKKKINYLLILLLVLGCTKPVLEININQEDVSLWEKNSINKLNDCCTNFQGSGMEIVMNRVFKNNVRLRVLQKLDYHKEVNFVEIFEQFSNSNNNPILVFINDDICYFSFKNNNNELVKIEKENQEVLGFKNKKEAIRNMKSFTNKCCDLENSHPYLKIYSKLIIKDNEIKLQESFIK